MSLPATIRINAAFPFPSQVRGSGPVTVGKQLGIWTLGFDIIDLGLANPSVANQANQFTIVYDNLAKTFTRVPLTALGIGGAKTQRSVTASPIVIASTDMVLNCNIAAGGPTCAIPLASTRGGVPLTFKDVGGQFGAHNLTLNFADALEGVAGPTAVTLVNNRQELTITPFNDGVNVGWFI